MDEACQEIKKLIGKLETFEKNYKKCSVQNKARGYLERRMKGIDQLWAKICDKGEEIKNLEPEADGESPQ